MSALSVNSNLVDYTAGQRKSYNIVLTSGTSNSVEQSTFLGR